MSQINIDKVKGVLYGKAIGDALGVPMEFRSSALLMKEVPPGQIEYRPTARKNASWKAGEWSDDTEMALAVVDAYLLGVEKDGLKATAQPSPRRIAERFLEWSSRDPRGMGNTTSEVLRHPLFVTDPLAAANEVWVAGGRNGAANGAVMRAASVGLLNPMDLVWTGEAAATVAKVTHPDPRCVAGSVAIALTVAALVSRPEVALPEVLQFASNAGSLVDPSAKDWILAPKSLVELNLDEGMGGSSNQFPPIGYTWKAAGAGFWALRQWVELEEDFRSADLFQYLLEAVLRAGGDTDTNAAVVGGLLGAVAGYNNIPLRLRQGLLPEGRKRLDGVLTRLTRVQSA